MTPTLVILAAKGDEHLLLSKGVKGKEGFVFQVNFGF